MGVPVFKLAIVSAKNDLIVSTWGGDKLEIPFSESVLDKLKEIPLGIFTSRSAVENAVAQAIHAVCNDLKNKSIDALHLGGPNVIQ